VDGRLRGHDANKVLSSRPKRSEEPGPRTEHRWVPGLARALARDDKFWVAVGRGQFGTQHPREIPSLRHVMAA
jgi:hypothetical protein